MTVTSLLRIFVLFIVENSFAQNCKIDIGFIIDESGSVGSHGFQQEKDFVRQVTSRLQMSQDNTRVSLITFSMHARIRIYFKDQSGQDWNSLNNKLTNMRHLSGRTNTEKALLLARTTMFQTASGARPGVPKILLLLSDGYSQSSQAQLIQEARLLRDNSINIIAIGAGPMVRRSELELMASRPISQHVFLVRTMLALGSIVRRVRTEACKPVKCFYNHCEYNEWSAWSGSCNVVTRQRTVRQQIRKSKTVVGGCAGLKTDDCKPETDTKDLATCLQDCKYVKCDWAQWSAWSASCGTATRQRTIKAEDATTKRRICQGLPQRCYEKPEKETKTLKCNCKYVECRYGEWSAWSPNCGKKMERKRKLQTIEKSADVCTGLPKTCTGDAEQTETKSGLCECDTFKCVAEWSAWSASCGLATRTMRYVKVPVKVKQESCDGMQNDCPKTTKTETDDLFCAKTRPPITTAESSDAVCSVNYKAMGCLKENKESSIVLKNILPINGYEESKRFGLVDYLMDIVCQCATKARNGKFNIFGISSEGHCLVGKEDKSSWQKKMAVETQNCRNTFQRPCREFDSHCIGSVATIYAYKIS